MALRIGFQCTACGACAAICPNGAIQARPGRYRIEPLLCTECLFYARTPVCAASCPSGAIREPDVDPLKRSDNE